MIWETLTRKRSVPALADGANRVRAHILLQTKVSRRRMFGAEAFFTGGRMFAFLGHQAVVVRLPEPLRADLIAQSVAFPYLPPGAVERDGWTEIPFHRISDEALCGLLDAAHDLVPVGPKAPRAPVSGRRRGRSRTPNP